MRTNIYMRIYLFTHMMHLNLVLIRNKTVRIERDIYIDKDIHIIYIIKIMCIHIYVFTHTPELGSHS